MNPKRTILIAADHAGFELKAVLILFLKERGYQVEDFGADTLDSEDDYPEIMLPLALRVSEKPDKYFGIVIGGSGQGEAIVCNRFPEVRAAVFYGSAGNEELSMNILKLSREHNDANVLSLGVRFLSVDEAKKAVQVWLETAFSGEERHIRRIAMIDSIV